MTAGRWLITLATIFSTQLLPTAGFQTSQAANPELQEFIQRVERLVLNTTDRALIITRNVYLNLSKEMPPTLLEATNQTMQNYMAQVQDALDGTSYTNFTLKRRLLRQFKVNNLQIELLRRQLEPLQPEFNFQLISDEFYKSEKNVTEFDNLYLSFMSEFAAASQQLWDRLSEPTVEEQQELLELLDEISKEQQLREKDKLYDEFIAMYLFKIEENEQEAKELY
uniref:Probable arginine--tRNA ligase, mitochondrial n=1 Tax=Zeugodacus cucurbitae TaxID=28588 RepID=A0A0A1WX05_ZEUCU